MSDRNHVWRRRRFQRPVLTLPMPLMHLWIIQQRRRRFLPLRNATQEFRITHKQRVDGLDHLPSDATNDARFPCIGLPTLIERTAGFDQALIQPCPLMVAQADHLHDGQEHDLLHGPGSPAGQVGGIATASPMGCVAGRARRTRQTEESAV